MSSQAGEPGGLVRERGSTGPLPSAPPLVDLQTLMDHTKILNATVRCRPTPIFPGDRGPRTWSLPH